MVGYSGVGLNGNTYFACGGSGKISKGTLSSNTPPIDLTTGVTEDLFAISVQGSLIVAVGGLNNVAVIAKSTNGGATFTAQRIIGPMLFAVQIVTPTVWYACGDGGLVLKTVDGGASFQPIKTGALTAFNCVKFQDANNGVLCGSDRVVMKTTDGGATFTTVDSGAAVDPDIYALASIGTELISVGGAGFVRGSALDGTGPTDQVVGANDLYGVSFAGTAIVAVGKNATIFRSTDNGATFTAPSGIPLCHIADVAFADANNGVCVGDHDWTISVTADGGASWATVIGALPLVQTLSASTAVSKPGKKK